MAGRLLELPWRVPEVESKATSPGAHYKSPFACRRWVFQRLHAGLHCVATGLPLLHWVSCSPASAVSEPVVAGMPNWGITTNPACMPSTQQLPVGGRLNGQGKV